MLYCFCSRRMNITRQGMIIKYVLKKSLYAFSFGLFLCISFFIFYEKQKTSSVSETEPIKPLSKEEIIDSEYGYLYPSISSDYE